MSTENATDRRSSANGGYLDCPECGNKMNWCARCKAFLCGWTIRGRKCGGSRSPVFHDRLAWAAVFAEDGLYYLFDNQDQAADMLGDQPGDVCPVKIFAR